MPTAPSPGPSIFASFVTAADYNGQRTLVVSDPDYGRCFAVPYIIHCDPDAGGHDTFNCNLIPIAAVKTYSKTVIRESIIHGVFYNSFALNPDWFEAPQHAEGITPVDLFIARLLADIPSYHLPHRCSGIPAALVEVFHAFGEKALLELPLLPSALLTESSEAQRLVRVLHAAAKYSSDGKSIALISVDNDLHIFTWSYDRDASNLTTIVFKENSDSRSTSIYFGNRLDTSLYVDEETLVDSPDSITVPRAVKHISGICVPAIQRVDDCDVEGVVALFRDVRTGKVSPLFYDGLLHPLCSTTEIVNIGNPLELGADMAVDMAETLRLTDRIRFHKHDEAYFSAVPLPDPLIEHFSDKQILPEQTEHDDGFPNTIPF